MAEAQPIRSWIRGLPLRSIDFPAGTPLNHFFAWNENAQRRDRRYVIACDLYHLITALGNDSAHQAAIAHLSMEPVVLARRGHEVLVRTSALSTAPVLVKTKSATSPASSSRRRSGPTAAVGTGLRRDEDAGDVAEGRYSTGRGDFDETSAAAAQQIVAALLDSVGSASIDKHAALFAAFERLAEEIDLAALARRRPRLIRSQRRSSPRRILIIRLSALGDFIQALGPIAAIRRHHRSDRLSLLTTAAFAEFARRLDFFDDVMIDRRPAPFDIGGWVTLRRRLLVGRFDRVYDLQTSQRSAAYARLFRPGAVPEWSGSAAGCSHPHANLDRDRQHTIDKQAEQLLMAGIHPTPLPMLPPLACELPQSVAGRQFVLMMPGSSPRHLAKRWPAPRFGMLAQALRNAGYASIVIGSQAERTIAAAIREVCPQLTDLTGQTAIQEVAALAQRAVLAIGNDTGVTHLAAGAGCPVVALFSGASDPDWCAPRGRLVRILAARDLAELGVDRVMAEVCATLAECAAPAGIPQIAAEATIASGGRN